MPIALPFRHWPWQGSKLFLEKKFDKIQDLANATLKAFGFTKHLQAASLRGSVLNANPKAFFTLHRPRSSFLTSAEV
ncbi:hypothetical protein C4F40_13185 [Sphingobacterium sp. Ka21]|uniref:Uncharacterized protein n=1 Tax=Sphingobacterium pedocola TaxID=2082722 RepID=A0ABR9T8K5_9SPHI|nr:hypothetical protein [Sphingobacterium pedocola]